MSRPPVHSQHLQQVSIIENILLDRQRFPDKYKVGIGRMARDPKMLRNGICNQGHIIKSYDDMRKGTPWRCKICCKKHDKYDRSKWLRKKERDKKLNIDKQNLSPANEKTEL